MFQLPDLPYAKNALAPHISEETLEYHYGKHHQTYVTNLNQLTEGQPLAQETLESLILTQKGPIFNNAAQVWNHTFYWNSLSAKSSKEPSGPLMDRIVQDFGSFSAFREAFSKAAIGQFGSGWAWLCKTPTGSLVVEATSNADCPLQKGHKPLLTCDVWEHAYYIDYRNARAKYLEAWWNLVNWDFAWRNFQS